MNARYILRRIYYIVILLILPAITVGCSSSTAKKSVIKPLTKSQAESHARYQFEDFLKRKKIALTINDFESPITRKITIAPNGESGWEFRYIMKKRSDVEMYAVWSEATRRIGLYPSDSLSYYAKTVKP